MHNLLKNFISRITNSADEYQCFLHPNLNFTNDFNTTDKMLVGVCNGDIVVVTDNFIFDSDNITGFNICLKKTDSNTGYNQDTKQVEFFIYDPESHLFYPVLRDSQFNNDPLLLYFKYDNSNDIYILQNYSESSPIPKNIFKKSSEFSPIKLASGLGAVVPTTTSSSTPTKNMKTYRVCKIKNRNLWLYSRKRAKLINNALPNTPYLTRNAQSHWQKTATKPYTRYIYGERKWRWKRTCDLYHTS
tara:strand:- start:5219 stop:5953 length:735 start_codon:yes stop_codon:yes gene_type:complete